MRFMMIMKPNVDEQNWAPSAEAMAEMGKYNDELAKAGVLLALDGLHPTSEGARVSFRRRQAERHRRAVHRVKGADRRLLADPGQVQGRGRRVGVALPRRRRRRDRGAARDDFPRMCGEFDAA